MVHLNKLTERFGQRLRASNSNPSLRVVKNVCVPKNENMDKKWVYRRETHSLLFFGDQPADLSPVVTAFIPTQSAEGIIGYPFALILNLW